jgi:hypothetical protein
MSDTLVQDINENVIENVREIRQPLRVFIREENKRLADTVRKLEERIISLEKMIG